MSLIDTHCHIHDSEFDFDATEVIERARRAGIESMICVGTSEFSSHQAIDLSLRESSVFASIGVHPHDAMGGYGEIDILAKSHTSGGRLVAIGEIGLDYFYDHSPRGAQTTALESQLQTALDCDLPVIFHVREAFDDFWPIFDNFTGLRGVLHSFTDDMRNLEGALSRDLYVGVNGISLFTKDEAQQQLYDQVPIGKLLFETDAPYLTPPPYRGKINEPAYVEVIAEYHAQRRGISLDEIADATTTNAKALFAL